MAEIGLHVARAGAPQVGDLGEQRVVGGVAGRACRTAARRGRCGRALIKRRTSGGRKRVGADLHVVRLPHGQPGKTNAVVYLDGHGIRRPLASAGLSRTKPHIVIRRAGCAVEDKRHVRRLCGKRCAGISACAVSAASGQKGSPHGGGRLGLRVKCASLLGGHCMGLNRIRGMLCVIFGRALFFALTGAGKNFIIRCIAHSAAAHRVRRSECIAARRGRKHGGGRAHVIYVDSVVLQKSREYAL